MGEPPDVLLIQFAKAPVPGKVKTRLVPELGEQGACELHAALVQHTCRQLLASALGSVEIWVAGQHSGQLFQACLATGADTLRQQQGADLGTRMYSALKDGLGRAKKVLLVGSDCPGLDRDYLRAAVAALDSYPVVLGPAEDGGYVLIGATAIDEQLFAGVHWGEASVLAETMANVDSINWRVGLLDPRSDIDRPEDLQHWQGTAVLPVPEP